MMADKLKRKLKAGKIELDPNDPVIVVHYAHVTLKGDVEIERKPGSQRIKLKTFTPTSSIQKISAQIVSKCKYIHHSKGALVSNLLEKLRHRILKAGGGSAREPRSETSRARPSSGKIKSAPTTHRESKRIKPVVKVIKPVIAPQISDAAAKQMAKEAQKKEEEAKKAKEEQEKRKRDQEEKERLEKEEAERKQKAIAEQAKVSAALEAQHDGGGGKTSRKPKKDRKSRRKKNMPKARMKELDSYVELLYEEDMKRKIKGTTMILELVQNPENLDTFVQRSNIMQTLGRVLVDDLKRNTDLLINILQIFFCFSSFSQLHNLLLNNKVDDSTMRILELEHTRYQHRLAKWRKEGKNIQEKDQRKAAKSLHKQEHLLYISYYILLNLAEDSKIQVKMIQWHVVKMLLHELDRQESRSLISGTDTKMTDDLLQLVVIFLKAISIFEENIIDLGKMGAMKRLQRLYESTTHIDLRDEVMQLMFNLSFDEKQRGLLTNNGFHGSIVKAIEKPVTRHVAVKLLYHVTCGMKQPTEKETKSLEAATRMVCTLIINCRNKLVDDHLISLGVNLAAYESCAKVIADSEMLPRLIKRAHSNWDSLLMKMVRNLSDHRVIWRAFSPYMHQLVGMSLRAQNHDFLVEALSCLGNIQLPDILYHQLLIKHSLLEPLIKHLVPGFAEDDVVLAVVIVVGTFALDPKSAPLLADSNLVHKLYMVINDKIQDEDIVLQAVFALFRLCLHNDGREAVCAHEDLVNALLELMGDQSPSIRNMANKTLDLVVQTNSEVWQTKIREKRFEGMNREWIEFIERAEGQDQQEGFRGEEYGYYDEYDPSRMQVWDNGDEDQYVDPNDSLVDYGESLDSGNNRFGSQPEDSVEYGDSMNGSGRFGPHLQGNNEHEEKGVHDMYGNEEGYSDGYNDVDEQQFTGEAARGRHFQR